MNLEFFLEALLDVLGTIGTYLWKLLVWLAGLMQMLFGHIALAISTWLSTFTLPMMPAILKVFSNAAMNIAIFFAIVLYIFFINVASFMMFGIDKKRSKRRKARRIPERTLMSLSFMGGAGGAFLGMQIFNHKTQHRKFTIFVPLLFIIQLVLYSILLGFLGFWAFF